MNAKIQALLDSTKLAFEKENGNLNKASEIYNKALLDLSATVSQRAKVTSEPEKKRD